MHVCTMYVISNQANVRLVYMIVSIQCMSAYLPCVTVILLWLASLGEV